MDSLIREHGTLKLAYSKHFQLFSSSGKYVYPEVGDILELYKMYLTCTYQGCAPRVTIRGGANAIIHFIHQQTFLNVFDCTVF